MADSRGTFVLGLGAQKSGTTWLSEYLGSSPQYDGGFRKEYHVLDIVDLPDETWLRQRLVGLAGQALEAIERGEPADPDVLHRAAMVAHQDRYYDYFAGLIDGTTVLATGDHTPSHALLPAARLLAVREQMALRGVRTAAVFVMRDPVERVCSQIRMRLQRSGHPSPSTAEEKLLLIYDHPTYATRSRYEQTLATIDEVFDPSEVYLGFLRVALHGRVDARPVRPDRHRSSPARHRPSQQCHPSRRRTPVQGHRTHRGTPLRRCL